MQKFNTSDIFTGYLKQLLKDFNLPKLKVYTQEHSDYFKKYGVERSDILNTIIKNDGTQEAINYPKDTHYIPYIKDDKVQEYINGEWYLLGERINKKISPIYYNYGNKLLNYTKRLILKNNVYDSYTHEYLGDYLRFQRDYNNLNLMPLYNCFSNRACENLKISGEITEVITKGTNRENRIVTEHKTNFIFDTKDTNYKIYMVPVKLFQNYTIAIDSNQPIEMCCGIYNNYQDTRDKFENLPKLTYQKINQSQFTKPFLYTKLNIASLENWTNNPLTEANLTTLKKEIVKAEGDLKLFIKIPFKNSSTITILEGDYCDWNDNRFFKVPTKIYTNIIALSAAEIEAARENNFSGLDQIEIKTLIDNPKTEPLKFILDTDSESIYKFDKTDEGIELSEIGSAWGELANLSIKPNRFKLSVDEEVYAFDSVNGKTHYSITESAEHYRKTKNIYAPYMIYYNNNLKQAVVNAYTWTKQTNHSVINIEATKFGVTDTNDIELITQLQLLRLNTGEQHPFADRLIEYLLDNVIIDSSNEVPNNVRRVQKALRANSNTNNYTINFKGIWDYKINKLMYEYINSRQNTFETNHDILGYIDKDVEKYYTYKDNFTNKTISLMNTELEEGDK